MPIQKIFKGSDLLFDLKLTDANGELFRIKTLKEFNIIFYTTTKDISIECSYVDSVYTGIIEGDEIDSVVLNSSDLALMEDGILKYTYQLKVDNSKFSDNTYDETVTIQTTIYLKSN